jgi:hypothetical protein
MLTFTTTVILTPILRINAQKTIGFCINSAKLNEQNIKLFFFKFIEDYQKYGGIQLSSTCGDNYVDKLT